MFIKNIPTVPFPSIIKQIPFSDDDEPEKIIEESKLTKISSTLAQKSTKKPKNHLHQPVIIFTNDNYFAPPDLPEIKLNINSEIKPFRKKSCSARVRQCVFFTFVGASTLALMVNAVNDIDDGLALCDTKINLLPLEIDSLGLIPKNFLTESIIKTAAVFSIPGFDTKKIIEKFTKTLNLISSRELPDNWKKIPKKERCRILAFSGTIVLISFSIEVTNTFSIAEDDTSASIYDLSLASLSKPAAALGPLAFLFSECIEFLDAMLDFFGEKKDTNLIPYTLQYLSKNYFLPTALLNILFLRIPSGIASMLFGMAALTKLIGNNVSLPTQIALLIFLGLPKNLTDYIYNGSYGTRTMDDFLKACARTVFYCKKPEFGKLLLALIAMGFGGVLSFLQRRLLDDYLNNMPMMANENFKTYFLTWIVELTSYQMFITYSASFYDPVCPFFYKAETEKNALLPTEKKSPPPVVVTHSFFRNTQHENNNLTEPLLNDKPRMSCCERIMRRLGFR